MVYSTDDSFSYDENEEQEEETLMNNQQQINDMLDKRTRGRSKVTMVFGFVERTTVI